MLVCSVWYTEQNNELAVISNVIKQCNYTEIQQRKREYLVIFWCTWSQNWPKAVSRSVALTRPKDCVNGNCPLSSWNNNSFYRFFFFIHVLLSFLTNIRGIQITLQKKRPYVEIYIYIQYFHILFYLSRSYVEHH